MQRLHLSRATHAHLFFTFRQNKNLVYKFANLVCDFKKKLSCKFANLVCKFECLVLQDLQILLASFEIQIVQCCRQQVWFGKKHVQTLCAHLQKWACASANFHCKFANSAWHFANVFLLQNLCLDICVANAVFAHPQLLCAFVQTLACKSAILHCKLAKLGLHCLFCKTCYACVANLST